MNTDNITKEEDAIQTPQIFITNLIFNDGTQLALENNSIIVFTGANNCGKSQILKDIEDCMANNTDKGVVIEKTEYDYRGNFDNKTFLDKNFFIDKRGQYGLTKNGATLDIGTILYQWKNHRSSFFYKLFVKRLSTELRLTVSNSLERNYQAEEHPIYKLNQSDSLAQNVSDYFHQAFGEDLVINRNELMTIPLHVGEAPDKSQYTIAQQDQYYEKVSNLPTIDVQGDGMRSFASILLDTFTSEQNITLIDEPEAFLHPPQARVLGKMLAKNNPNNRQLFISTHSEDFLQGLLDADNDNVTVIRIDRINNINNISVLQNNEIKKLWSKPLLRYSNILNGLFHKKVVICESDYDCLFYQALIDAIYENNSEISPDILFTHCGGKSRIKDVVKALKSLNVPVVAICDFDLVNQSQDFKPTIAAFGIDWDMVLDKDMRVIFNNMNADKDMKDRIKQIGKIGFTGEAPACYDNVELICKAAGLFIVPVGEMECFDKTTNKKKKDWVYEVIEKYDLAIEPKLENARKFVKEIVDFQLN